MENLLLLLLLFFHRRRLLFNKQQKKTGLSLPVNSVCFECAGWQTARLILNAVRDAHGEAINQKGNSEFIVWNMRFAVLTQNLHETFWRQYDCVISDTETCFLHSKQMLWFSGAAIGARSEAWIDAIAKLEKQSWTFERTLNTYPWDNHLTNNLFSFIYCLTFKPLPVSAFDNNTRTSIDVINGLNRKLLKYTLFRFRQYVAWLVPSKAQVLIPSTIHSMSLISLALPFHRFGSIVMDKWN